MATTSCPVCGSEGFDTSDGLYFCTDCGTQSQDVREEAAEDDYVDTSCHRQLRKKRREGKDNQEGSTANVSVENFQCMLQRQANALIQLGYNPSLKESLKYLWFLYLEWFMKKMTIIVHNAPQKQMFRGIRQYSGRKRKAELKAANAAKRTKLLCTVKQEGGGSGGDADGTRGASNIGVSDKEECSHDGVGVVDFSVLKRDKRFILRCEPMPSKILAILLLYLALMYSGQTLLVVDLIRLLNRNKLPRIGYEHTGLVSERDLRPDLIIQYIPPFFRSVLKLPMPAVDYHQLGCVMIDRLLLPDSLRSCLRRLLQVYCPTFQTPAPIMNRGEASTNPDLLIAAMIVVLMKLVYRLDDVFEIQQSMVANTIDQSFVERASSVYAWSDWVHLIKCHHVATIRSGVVTTKQDLVHGEGHLSAYVDYCEQMLERERQSLLLVPKHKAIISTIQTTFKSYLSKQPVDSCSDLSEPNRMDGAGNGSAPPSPRLVPINQSLPDLGRAADNYQFVPPYNVMNKLPVHLMPYISSSFHFLLQVMSRLVGYCPQLLLAGVRSVETEVRRRTEIATLTVTALVETTQLQNTKEIMT